VGLASDSASVEARAVIHPEFKQLVRDNTQFWSTSGFEIDIGLRGIQLNADTLSTIAMGGVAFATPNQPGRRVTTGHRFVCYEDPDDQWLSWRPSIPRGTTLLPEGATPPRPVRVSLHWTTRQWGLKRRKHRQGWVLPLEDGWILGPADLLVPTQEANDEQAILELAGKEIAIDPKRCKRIGPLALYRMEPEQLGLAESWKIDRIRAADQPEEALVIADPQAGGLALASSRLTVDGNTWAIDLALPLENDWHGASVLSRRDGYLVGVLHMENARGRVLLWSEEAGRALD
jgi:hypothetical protein